MAGAAESGAEDSSVVEEGAGWWHVMRWDVHRYVYSFMNYVKYILYCRCFNVLFLGDVGRRELTELHVLPELELMSLVTPIHQSHSPLPY